MEWWSAFVRRSNMAMSLKKTKENSFILWAVALILLVILPVISYAGYSYAGYQSGPAFGSGASISPPTVSSLVHALEKNSIAGRRFANLGTLKNFYARREGDAFWLDGHDGARDRAESMLVLMEDAWTHGMNPGTYHAPEIRALLEERHPDPVALELLLSDAAIRYGHDISGMRIDPASIRQKAKFWRTPLSPGEVLEFVSASHDPVGALAKLAPQDSFYNRLREELVRLSDEQESFKGILPIRMTHMLYPGDSGRAVPQIRARLDVEHRETDGPATFYDDRLAAAVMAFQHENGLSADGVIGSKTLKLLNRTNRDKMEQIVANLERLRWLKQDKPQRYILVNLPNQMLWAVEDGKTALEMKVVVGMPERPTEDFTATVTGIRFNPTWTVPDGIKMKDMLPKLREDPYALSDKGIEFYKGYGSERVTIDPATIDWNNISRQEAAQIRMVQSSGDHNALGRIRVLMANEFNMYMHDTNHPEFFELTDRTKSSGCIRLHEPDKMAMWILSHNKGWTRQRMFDLIDNGKMVEIPAADPIPVYIVYQTIWQDSNGELIYGSDIYNRDHRLISALAAQNAFWLPENISLVVDTKDISATLASAE